MFCVCVWPAKATADDDGGDDDAVVVVTFVTVDVDVVTFSMNYVSVVSCGSVWLCGFLCPAHSYS